MKNNVINKTIEYPLILSNNEYAHLLLILNDYKDSIEYKKWFIQNFNDIYIIKRNFSEFEHIICFLQNINERILDKCPFIKIKQIARDNIEDVESEIKRRIDEGNFVILQLDKYYLPCSSEYQKMNIIHRVLLYGYDDDSETFKAADMFKLTGYMIEQIKYDDLKQAYFSCFKMGNTLNNDFEIISYEDSECSFDIQSLKEKINLYIEKNEAYHSCEIYQALIRSLQQENYLDEISCNVLYEFQRIITRKVEIMQEMDLINLSGCQLKEVYDLEAEMMKFRNYYMKYRIKNKLQEQSEEKNKILYILSELHKKHIKIYKLLLENIKEIDKECKNEKNIRCNKADFCC